METVPRAVTEAVVERALAEDTATDDITTRWSVPAGVRARARLVAKDGGVVAGLPVVAEVLRQVAPEAEIVGGVEDGARVRRGDVILRVRGDARAIVTAERTLLNFLQRLSGIASLTDQYVAAARPWGTKILDTRKTAPGLRQLDKYAVTVGGGHNHRMDLSTAVILKENHIAMAGGVCAAIKAVVKAMAAEGLPNTTVIVEVRTREEAREAARAGARWIMLDNLPLSEIVRVVAMRGSGAVPGHVVIEASGNITLDQVRRVAATGVDALSAGTLTHSADAFDVSLLLDPIEA